MCVRYGWLVDLETKGDGGYSAFPHIISAGETDLTQMIHVIRKGYGNKTRKTDGKTNPLTTTNKSNQYIHKH